MTVEYRNTRGQSEQEGRDFAPEKQYELFQAGASYSAEGYQYKTGNNWVPTRNFTEWENSPEIDKTAKVMSISELEVAARGSSATSRVSEPEAVGSIRGSVAHEITLLVNQFMLATMAEKPLDAVALNLPSFNQEVLPHIDQIFMDQASALFWNDPEIYNKINPSQVVDFVHDGWQRIRNLHQFTDYKHRNSTIPDGEQWNSNWVQNCWYDPIQLEFEDRVFQIEKQKVKAYLENPLFDGDKYLFIPLEMHPDLFVAAEEPIRKIISFGDYSIMFTGQIDYHLRNPERDIYVDKKFGGNYDTLRTEVTEAQSLVYSYITTDPRIKNQTLYTSMTPLNSFFYNDWYDVWSDTPTSYLVDLTITPDRLLTVQENLARYTRTWRDNYAAFREVKKKRERAFITPFLAAPL